ncbi:uncharacterized protein I206_106161 [Kwoniella pini CBS 10737]|uniref:Pali-domain-containing protein n=1 Tax=Kwoniella pini CBS 10737 TaxID=1296096 RepID=A0A1B9I186_9TREE|nr:uncharacterized protein I206_04986 [Kwoniella pini CBS 10737]OCF49297.1 hypothetical protein I206_04986 [Kwoniella pini CBS 10737]
MVSPAFPGLFLAFAAVALLVFASVSPPAWDKVNFLHASSGTQEVVYGVFGYCIKGGECSSRSVGYDLQLPGSSNVVLNSKVLHNLTYTLILHPIAGGFAFFSLVFGILGAIAASRVLTIFMAITAFFGALITLVIFVIDMVLWNVLKNRIQDAGYTAGLGNANWFTIGAFAALALSSCTSCCGAFGRFASGRMAGEKY